MEKIAIIIQGASTNVLEQKEKWVEYKDDSIFSTWAGSEKFYNENDIVVFNQEPETAGPMNFNHQVTSTYNGLLKAKELGYKKALKIRSDIVPTNAKEFMKLLNNESFNFVAWQNHEVHPNCSGYLVDYLMSGHIDDMIKLWHVKNNISPVPEVKLTLNYIENMETFVSKDINYFLDFLNEGNDLFWIKKNIPLSHLQEHYKFHRGFSNNKTFLNKDYINFLK